jgi:hypothetical protein
MHRRTLTSLSPNERMELSSLIKKYTKKPGVMKEHEDWHMTNGPGGLTGPGSGKRFLAFHRNYVGKLEDLIKSEVSDGKKLKKFVPLPKWKPSTIIPIEFAYAGRLTDDPKIKTPTWLTVKGGASMTGNTTATSGSSAKTHLEDGIKALQSGDKEGAMTQLTAAQQAMSGSSPDAIKHFEEGMKALESGDSNGAIMHLQIAEQSLG